MAVAARRLSAAEGGLSARERLIVGLDLPTVDAARRIVEAVDEHAGVYKIGLQLIYAGGLELAAELASAGRPVFLDAKFYDIDQTVAGGVGSVRALGATFLTVHAIGRTVAAAAAARGDDPLKLLAVTVLTSHGADELDDLGRAGDLESLVLRRALAAQAAGADGVVASGREAARIREAAGDGLLIVTPGIRPAGSDHGDQRRPTTPADAIAAGADYLVVARPIVQAKAPGDAARRVVDEIADALS